MVRYTFEYISFSREVWDVGGGVRRVIGIWLQKEMLPLWRSSGWDSVDARSILLLLDVVDRLTFCDTSTVGISIAAL